MAQEKHPSVQRNSDQVDLWLQRASHASQLGLLLFTAWALYFTVIPFYQKALLDEKIAQKEIELSELQGQLESAYRTIRGVAVADYIFASYAECSGLLVPVEIRKTFYDDDLAAPNSAASTLAIAPRECLLAEFDRHRKLEELTMVDREFLRERVLKVAERAEAAQALGLQRLQMSEAKARSKAKIAAKEPLDENTIGGLIVEDKGPEFREAFEYWTALQAEVADIEDEYRGSLDSALRTLSDLSWPEEKPKQE